MRGIYFFPKLLALRVCRRQSAESASSAVQRGEKTPGAQDKLEADSTTQEMLLEPDPDHTSEGETLAREDRRRSCRCPCPGRMFQTSQVHGADTGKNWLSWEKRVGSRKGLRNLLELVVLNPTGKKDEH